MSGIRIIEMSDEYVEGFHRCVGIVARERKYLALLDSPPVESTRAFVKSVVEGGGVQFIVVNDTNDVVGWCDIRRTALEGFQHSGHLGMGLLPEIHGRGIGRRLAEMAIDAARARGIERVELEVFASNTRAIRLYERLGFAHEGVRRRARKLDGVYDDNVMMALVF